jgi:hypothetical protein
VINKEGGMNCPICNGYDIGTGPWEDWKECPNCDWKINHAMRYSKDKAKLDVAKKALEFYADFEKYKGLQKDSTIDILEDCGFSSP